MILCQTTSPLNPTAKMYAIMVGAFITLRGPILPGVPIWKKMPTVIVASYAPENSLRS